MPKRVDTHMTNLEFMRLHALQGSELAQQAAGVMATESFFDFQVPFAERIPRQTLAMSAERARKRAEKMFDHGVSLYSVLPAVSEVL